MTWETVVKLIYLTLCVVALLGGSAFLAVVFGLAFILSLGEL